MNWEPPTSQAKQRFTHTISITQHVQDQLVKISVDSDIKITELIRSMVTHCLTTEKT